MATHRRYGENQLSKQSHIMKGPNKSLRKAISRAALLDIARRYGSEATPKMLAEKHNLQLPSVYAAATNLRAVGIKIPKVSRSGIYLEIAAELSKTNPELIEGGKKKR